MKKILLTLALTVAGAIAGREATACTNFIITRGASTDGSIMVTYAADSHQLYGCLYKYTPSKRAAAMMPVYEWDTGSSSPRRHSAGVRSLWIPRGVSITVR